MAVVPGIKTSCDSAASLLCFDLSTDPGPEGVGRVAPAALEELLTAEVGNHVVVQHRVPVAVASHSAASPLVKAGNEIFQRMAISFPLTLFFLFLTSPWMVFHASVSPALLSVV